MSPSSDLVGASAEPVLVCPSCHAENPDVAFHLHLPPLCTSCGAALPWLHAGSDQSFATDIQARVPVLVDFWAAWCGPGVVMGPILKEVAEELAGKVRIVKINVDHYPKIAGQFQVQGIPTMLMFLDGELVDEVVGAVPKFMLVDRVKHLLTLG